MAVKRYGHWVEAKGDAATLHTIEKEGIEVFLEQRKSVMLYGAERF